MFKKILCNKILIQNMLEFHAKFKYFIFLFYKYEENNHEY